MLDLAIDYVRYGCYTQERREKRAVRKRAAKLVMEKGEVFLQKKEWKVFPFKQHNI